MSLFALCLLMVCPVLLLLVAVRYFRLRNYRLVAVFILLALSVGFIGGFKAARKAARPRPLTATSGRI